MKRSTGVTASAILVFLGSAITLVFGVLMVFVVLFASQQPPQPAFVRGILAFSLALYLGFGIWGTASGVGLLRLRQWARISTLVFSGMLLVFTMPSLLILPFLPMPGAEGQLDRFALTFKLGMGAVYGAIAAIGGGWLYFFNKSTVKEQFRSLAKPGVAEPFVFPPPSPPSRRPLSITIIGGLMLLGPFFLLPTMLTGLPLLFLGQMLDGWRAVPLALTMSVVQGFAGVGLLRLRPWARNLAIGFFLLGFLNFLTMALPGSMARMEQFNASMYAKMGIPTMPGSLEILHISLWAAVVFGAVGVAIQLWFVVTRKSAFSEPPEATALVP